MAISLGLENLSPAKKLVLYLLPPLIIIGLAVFLSVIPALDKIKKLSAEVNKQQAEIQDAQRKTAGLPALMAENERLKRRLTELETQLPEEREVSGLLRQVSEIGIKSGLQVVSWKPKQKNVHGSKEVYEVPVEVEMRGHYHQFGQFFSTITGLNRIVNIGNINVKTPATRQTKGPASLIVSFTATTYSVIPEDEKKAMAAKEKEKEKGKKT